MSSERKNELTRIGVFYDGNYFFHVSNYYNYVHKKKSRISIPGLHDFIREKVAKEENTSSRHCQIVDAHYFRGRFSARESNQIENKLYHERIFDDVLMKSGIITHYLPIKTSPSGVKQEKGIDVLLALEAFELAFYKRFSVLVLITPDGDYLPLIRKLNTLGTKVMLLYWDFEYEEKENKKITKTSQDLLEAATYDIAMHTIIEDRSEQKTPLIQNFIHA